MRLTTARHWIVAAMAIAVGGVALGSAPATAQSEPTVAVTAIDLTTDTIVITNSGSDQVDANGIILCNFPVYVPIAGADPIPAGGSITVDAGALGVELGDDDGELGLYGISEFDNPDAIISYVEWGSTGHQRSEVAVAAGVWDGGSVAAAATLTATVDAPTAASQWTSGAAAAEEPEPELPTTGIDGWMVGVIAVALLLIAAGAATMQLSRRPG